MWNPEQSNPNHIQPENNWKPTTSRVPGRQEREQAAELLFTELRRGLALASGTFNHEQSRKRAYMEATRIRDGVNEALLDSALGELDRIRLERGVDELSQRISTAG
jgi:hypothetical protein